MTALRQRIDAFDSGRETSLRSLTFELPPALRDLYGEDLANALRPLIEGYRLELHELQKNVGTAGHSGPLTRTQQ